MKIICPSTKAISAEYLQETQDKTFKLIKQVPIWFPGCFRLDPYNINANVP